MRAIVAEARFTRQIVAATGRPSRISPALPPLTSVTLQATLENVKIRNFVHKGLKRFYERGDPKGLPHSSLDKISKMIVYLEAMDEMSELLKVLVWKPHLLSGSRKGAWSLHVTRNWRITFWIDEAERAICDVNFEDYH